MNDKAKVENGVLLAERWVLARLRNRRFYSLGEANIEVEDITLRRPTLDEVFLTLTGRSLRDS